MKLQKKLLMLSFGRKFLLYDYLSVKGGVVFYQNGSSSEIISQYVRAIIHLYYNKALELGAVVGSSVGTR